MHLLAKYGSAPKAQVKTATSSFGIVTGRTAEDIIAQVKSIPVVEQPSEGAVPVGDPIVEGDRTQIYLLPDGTYQKVKQRRVIIMRDAQGKPLVCVSGEQPQVSGEQPQDRQNAVDFICGGGKPRDATYMRFAREASAYAAGGPLPSKEFLAEAYDARFAWRYRVCKFAPQGQAPRYNVELLGWVGQTRDDEVLMCINEDAVRFGQLKKREKKERPAQSKTAEEFKARRKAQIATLARLMQEEKTAAPAPLGRLAAEADAHLAVSVKALDKAMAAAEAAMAEENLAIARSKLAEAYAAAEEAEAAANKAKLPQATRAAADALEAAIRASDAIAARGRVAK